MASLDVLAPAGGGDSGGGGAAGGCGEVVQCYVRDPPARHARRPLRLVAFERVELAHGERRRRVTVELTAEHLAVLGDDGRGWGVLPGAYSLVCGRSADDAHALEMAMTLA